ncbi:MAG TPA: cupin domain-containing protein [Ferruginibacter sp.]|nr:cupin domain-containing protein [Ferruginibacter sp.]
MNIKDYIASGILEAYCLGFVTDKERAEVEAHAMKYYEIKEELLEISDSLEQYALKKGVVPKSAVKTKLLLLFYEGQSGPGKKYPPLIMQNTTAVDFKEWIAVNRPPGFIAHEPAEPYDNLSVHELPSTEVVTNFMVWVKKGHEEEVHTDYNEFIVILKGHCDMYFNGKKEHYNAGEIIVIKPGIPHYAVITSDEPMVAVVQRVMIAA